MNIVIVYYSFTGNNKNLAESIAKELSAEQIEITEPISRTMGKITSDAIFNRIPKVHPAPVILKNYDMILLFGPVWLGQVAFPLRAYLKYLRKDPKDYAFISISGGPDGKNPKLESELIKRAGKRPAGLINLFISDLLSSNKKITPIEIESYHLKEEDIINLNQTVLKKLNDFIAV